MPPNLQTTSKSKLKRNLIIAIISLLIVAIVVVGLYLWGRNPAVSLVKDELNKAVSAMESKRSETGAYPATITNIIALASDRVKLSGSSSFDGTTYCITGTSSSDKSVVFHVDSTKASQGIQSGTCETSSDLSIPSTPGGLAVAFADSTGVKVTWDVTLYATSYTMQCSTDSDFSNPITTDVTDTTGMCEKLETNTTYYCRVKATNTVGDSAWSAILKTDTL
ncbi:MAG TPA: fibronectin type III domain-containing protein [Candidatus Angelobacter sp.]|nr:fibronectin type III domain-containing protein [Candidatus Angelobacter sp.]